MLEKTDLSSLGPHFEQSLQSHQEKHKTKDAAVRARKRKVQLLADKLSNVSRSRQLAKSSKTARYAMGDPEGSTDVSFYLATVGTTLPVAAKKLLNPAGRFYRDYLDNGASYRKKEELLIKESAKDRLARERISVYAYLETVSEQTVTDDEIYVGTILDAETLLVPGKTTGYIKINQSDPRFEATLTIVSFINDKTKSSKIRVPIHKPRILPSIPATTLVKKLARTDKVSIPKLKPNLKHIPSISAATSAKKDEVAISKPKTAATITTQDKPKTDEPAAIKLKPVITIKTSSIPKIDEIVVSKPKPKLKLQPVSTLKLTKIDDMLAPKPKPVTPVKIQIAPKIDETSVPKPKPATTITVKDKSKTHKIIAPKSQPKPKSKPKLNLPSISDFTLIKEFDFKPTVKV